MLGCEDRLVAVKTQFFRMFTTVLLLVTESKVFPAVRSFRRWNLSHGKMN